MNWSLFIASVLLLFTVAYDFFFTVISINGAGLVSSRLSGWISELFLNLNKAVKGRKMLNYCGVSIILSLIIWWIGGLWLGFYLLILSDERSVVTASTGIAADVSDKFYYSGYVLSTMGNGDFVPGSPCWQIVIAVFSFSGFIFITTAMTYLISVSSAVIHKRSLSLYINDIMTLNEEDRINCLYENAAKIRNMINRHNQNHFAYPVVHYFFSTDKKTSFSIGLWKLNALLTSIQNDSGHPSHKVMPLIRSIDNYLSTMSEAFIPKNEGNPGKNDDGSNLKKLQLIKLLNSDGWYAAKKEIL
jgi:hypothetical protein